jgi:hypothetical protein
MMNFIKNFRADTDGAVTVGWVVLTAAIVGLGMAVLATVHDGKPNLAGDIDASTCVAGIPDDIILRGEGFSVTLDGAGTELNRLFQENGISISPRCGQ